jgi:hypothetical protein
MKTDRPTAPVEPTDVIGSIFTARRDLLHGVRAAVAGSGFSVEEADLLVSLYGARVLNWDDLKHDKEGFVAFSHLEKFLVHNPSLLSRRITKLAQRKPALLKVQGVDPALGLHFNAKQVRITDEGVKRIEPVWKRYQQMATKVLEGVSESDLRAHLTVNEHISKRIRERRDGLGDLFAGTSLTGLS